jgi:hypothetical protein
MTVTGNVTDDLNSGFAGATAMAVVEHRGQTYVIAGGGDDGISLFQILPGGQFLALAHLADTAAIGLSDVSAISAQSTPTGIKIFAYSSSQTGSRSLDADPKLVERIRQVVIQFGCKAERRSTWAEQISPDAGMTGQATNTKVI